MESRKQLKISIALKNTAHCTGAWGAILKAIRKAYLRRAGIDWFDFQDSLWTDFGLYQRRQLLEVLSECPREGPMFGLLPDKGEYVYGLSVEDAYGNYRDVEGLQIKTIRTDREQAFVEYAKAFGQPGREKSKVVSFEMYRRRVA